MTPEEVRRIATLARLRLSDEEAVRIAAQFGTILGHLSRLRSVPTDGVPPLDHPLPLHDVLRDDVLRDGKPRDGGPVAGLARADALLAAPDAAGGFFRVPRVMADPG